jgi:hypothetical protein
MTGKKIEFSKKPSKQNTDKFIDSWVLGVDNTTPIVNSLKRTTIYLPEDLRQKLKFLALKENTTMTEIIITTLKQQLK